jgi:hypothetical protein
MLMWQLKEAEIVRSWRELGHRREVMGKHARDTDEDVRV